MDVLGVQEKAKDIEILLSKKKIIIITEKFANPRKDMDIQFQEAQKIPNNFNQLPL